MVDDDAEVVEFEVHVVAEVLDLGGEESVGVGGAVFGLDDDEDAGVARGLALAAAAVVGGGVHAEAEAGRAVDDDGVIVGFDGGQGSFQGCFAGADPGELDVQEEGVGAGGQQVEAVAEAGVLNGDDEIGQAAFGLAGHVLGEAVALDGQRLVAELLGEVALGVEVHEEDAQSEAGEVFVVEGRGVLVLGEGGREVLGDADGVERARVLGEGFAGACGDGGLADAALLVAGDNALRVLGAYDGGRRVRLQPHDDGLGEALDEGDAPGGAVGAEAVPLAVRQEGGEGLGAGGVDGGEVGSEPSPCLDACFDGVLDVDVVLGGPDLQVLLQYRGQLGDDLLAVAGEGEVMTATLLTPMILFGINALVLAVFWLRDAQEPGSWVDLEPDLEAAGGTGPVITA